MMLWAWCFYWIENFWSCRRILLNRDFLFFMDCHLINLKSHTNLWWKNSVSKILTVNFFEKSMAKILLGAQILNFGRALPYFCKPRLTFLWIVSLVWPCPGSCITQLLGTDDSNLPTGPPTRLNGFRPNQNNPYTLSNGIKNHTRHSSIWP